MEKIAQKKLAHFLYYPKSIAVYLKNNAKSKKINSFSPWDNAFHEKKLPVILTTATISLRNNNKASYSAVLAYWHIFRVSRRQ